MATPLFETFRDDVRLWSNRDAAALPDAVIEQAMSFTADNSYHQLMIPPLESTFTYDALTATDIDDSTRYRLNVTELAVPSDLISIMHLRTTGENGDVYNEKTDIRTFHDLNSERYSSAFWTRQGNNFLLSGFLGVGDIFELFYYKRLPALNARYNISARNFNAGLITVPDTQRVTGDDSVFFVNGTTYADVMLASPPTAFDTAAAAQATQDDDELVAFEVLFLDTDGTEVTNWLRDENRKILLFGALSYCGKFLQDSEMAGANEQQYQAEIKAVNMEEKLRKASGGNVQMHFNGRGLI